MIDDDVDDHEIFEIALAEIDRTMSILHFIDCESALSHFSDPDSEPPGFVFVDINLPRMTGGVCLENLQNLRQFDNPKIVIYSSSIPVEWKRKLEEIGVHDFLEKTGSLTDLRDKLSLLTAKSDQL